MKTRRLLAPLAVLLLLTSLYPAPAVVSAPAADPQPPADLLQQLGAQAGVSQVSYHRATGQVNFISLDAARPYRAASLDTTAAITEAGQAAVAEAAARTFLADYGALFGLADQQRELRLMRTRSLDKGRSYARFQQLYQGIPVMGGEVIVQMDGRFNTTAALGEVRPGLDLPTRATINAAAAQATALQAVAGWHAVDAAGLQATAPELWVFDPALIGPRTGPARLVWRVEVTPVALAPIRELVLVDALRGTIALNINQVDTALLRRTYDANGGTSLPGSLVCEDPSNPTCAGGDPRVVAAHVNAGVTYNYFANVHGRDSIDGAGLTLTSTVDYRFVAAEPFDNAFWNGVQMAYGDARDFSVALDVVAHELTHGITQYESNLFYYYQSGAINESFSDVWGEFLDLVTASGGLDNDTGTARWLVGEDITPAFLGGAIRDMADPPAFGDPDRMSSPDYEADSGDESDYNFDYGGVHSNSGVNNKAVALMVDGTDAIEGGPFNGLTVLPLGITPTAQIYYEAATNLLTSGSDYLDLYNALNQACASLFGNGSSNCTQVRNALDAVEMDEEPVAEYNDEAALCPAGQNLGSNVFFDNLESGAGNWTFGNTGLGGGNRWSVFNQFAYSGTSSLLANDFPGAATDSFAAMNASVAVPANAFLHFAQAYGLEQGSYDGGVVEYSTDGGATWSDAGPLFSVNGYNGTIDAGALNGRPGFVEDSHGYISSRASLASLAGQNVRFRFRMSTDTSGVDMGWFVDDVRIYTCAASSATRLLYLPVAPRAASAAVGWTEIKSETFEGDFPNTWTVTDPGFEEYFWGKRNCRAASGGFSGWAIGGGSAGNGLTCGSNYPDFAFSWMIFGPFSLADAQAAELNARIWLNAAADDQLCLMTSLNFNDPANAQFYGTCYGGSSGGAFAPGSLDLADVHPDLPSVLGQPAVWVAVLFQSDGSGNTAEGAHVDDIVVRKCTTASCPAASGAALAGSGAGLTATPARFEFSATTNRAAP